MSRYSDQDKRRILEVSRATLAELEAERAFQADVSSELRSPEWIEELLGPSDPLEKWRRGQLEAEAERAAYRQREAVDTNTRRSRDWERWADARIARALFDPDGEFVQTIGAVIAEERHRERQERKVELDKVRAEFAQALAEYGARGDECVRQIRQELAVAKGFGAGTVIDLAAEPVIRKTRDNAA